MNYNLKITWSDNNEKYKCTETWDDLTKDKLYKQVIEYLDILHENGIPYEPTLQMVKENFLQFGVIEEDVINNEFNRLMVGWNAWKEFEEKMKIFPLEDECIIADEFTLAVDDNTTIEVEGYKFKVEGYKYL